METIQLKITKIKTAARDAILVYLQEENMQPVPYEAGQFFTFMIELYGRTVSRSYSIASTPGIDEEIFIAIKRHVNGEVSRYLTDNLRPGQVLRALPPAGRFTIEISHEDPGAVFFIAAGSGITPVFSLLKKLLYFDNLLKVILVFQNRDEESIIFKKELQALEQQFSSRFVLISLLSDPLEKIHIPQRLNNSLLEQLILSHYTVHAGNIFYLCGPGNFMRMARFVIKLIGVNDAQIHTENFVIDPPPPAPLISDRSPKDVTILWKERTLHFIATYPVNILQAALNNGIHLPYSCRGGRCSTCTVKCITGKVKMSINQVLTDRDLAAGLVLTCVGYAETDVVLEV